MRMMCVTKVLLAVLLAGAWASADEVILKDGRKFTGDILREAPDGVSIKTVGGILNFTRDDIARVVWKVNPRKLYRQKSDSLNARAVTARVELARWCMAQGMNDEARRELEQVLLIDPGHADAQELLGRLAKTTARSIPLRVEVTLTDGSEVKGRLVNPLFALETPYGVLHIPTTMVTGVVMGNDKAPDAVETEKFRAKGHLTEELFMVDSKLGRLTIAKKDIREFNVYQPTAEEVAEMKFNDRMREYNHFGLDVMLVIDSTDSMVGTLLRLRQQSGTLCRAVQRFVPNTQFGVVSYRDHRQFDPEEFTYVTKLFPLTAKMEEFCGVLRDLRAKGGGDIPEAVFEGLSEAMTRGGWRPKSRRVIILIGDAPPRAENNGFKKTLALVGDWHKNALGTVHAVDTTGYNRLLDEFSRIAETGGGQAVVLNDEKKIVRELVPLILGVEWRDRFVKAVHEAAMTPEPDDGDVQINR